MYRGFIKDNQNLDGQSLGSPDLRIRSMRINRDILSKATSEFEVINVPDAASEGNIFGVYDDYGSVVYLGVITSISENVIQTDQIIALFDDDWLWSNPAAATIEETVAAIIEDDWATNTDTMLQNIFSQFTVTAETQDVALQLPSQDDNFVTNFMEFIFQLYEAYGILLDISISYNDIAPTIKVFKPSYERIQLGNNTNAVRNFNITTETFETNKLVVYSKDGSEYRGSWYGTTSGITTNSAAGNRLPKINTKYVFSDDATDDIVGEYLTDDMYNHKINVELVLANKLYNFDDFKLGQEFDIFYNDTYYNSILTGYKINVDSEGKAEIATLIFGKVRYSLENKLYKLSQSSNTSSSSGGGGGGGGGGGDFKFVMGKPIKLYDTDETTVLYSRNPENLVFYDGVGGEEISTNYIYASPVSNLSLPTAYTSYWPTLKINAQKGSGFEIASNGDVKCNKNGRVRVTAVADIRVSNSTAIGCQLMIAKNRVGLAPANSYGYAGWFYNMEAQWIGDVVEGDTFNMRLMPQNANSTTSLSSQSSLLCEYVEDYYITQALSNTKKVLYSGGTYTTTTVTLAENVSKYDYLKVIFVNNDNVYSSVDVYQPEGKNITAWANTTANGDGSYAKTATFSISGNTITSRSSQYQHYMRQSLITTTTVQNVGIYAVIGEKFGNKSDTDIDKIYPVGSIYMSVNNTSPSELFGGTWQQIKDTFLLSAGDTYNAGDTGGEATHTLSIDEMPSHSHVWSRRSTSSVASGIGLTGASNTEYQAAITEAIRATGGDQPHNNMPPYLVVYIWQRTA